MATIRNVDLEVLPEAAPEQVADVRALLDAARYADDHEPLGEHKWLDLVHGGREGYAGVIARRPGEPHPVGYAQLSAHGRVGEPTRQWGLEVVTHPEHRGTGVELALVEQALQVVEDRGGGHVHYWVFRPTDTHEQVARRIGLRRGRDLLHMRVGLPVSEAPRPPEGVVLRGFRPGQDEEAWLEVNARAFAQHPEQGAWDRETLEQRMREPWFDPGGFLLAWDGESLAGFCWVKVEREHDRGEIYVIAVDPSYRGSGLGKALTLAGLRWMAEAGLHTAALYVDAENEAAVGLYRRLGFEVHHLDRAYVIDVAGS